MSSGRRPTLKRPKDGFDGYARLPNAQYAIDVADGRCLGEEDDLHADQYKTPALLDSENPACPRRA